ncbi:MAG: carboxymuconolactone decarboxylase family protein [Hyphomonadaceae bacterium]
MANFPLHTIMSAPGGAKPFLAMAQRVYKRVPNLAATLAESPPAIEAYFALDGLFARSELSEAERKIVLLAAAIEQECHYCTAFHLHAAATAGVGEATLTALREGAVLDDLRLEALRSFTVAVVRRRGVGCDAETEAALEHGYSRAALLDVMLGVALEIFANYVNHIAETPIDDWLAAAREGHGA